MKILNQDKTSIAYINNIINISIEQDLENIGYPYSIDYETDDVKEELGRYKTLSRAKEIILEIYNTHEEDNYIMPNK